MANYKVVDADKLDSDLKGLADKLRAKTNTEEEIAFPEGFETALDNVGEDLNTEITEQEALIAELKETLANKASGGSGGGSAVLKELVAKGNGEYDPAFGDMAQVGDLLYLKKQIDIPTELLEQIAVVGKYVIWNAEFSDVAITNQKQIAGVAGLGFVIEYITIDDRGSVYPYVYVDSVLANLAGIPSGWYEGFLSNINSLKPVDDIHPLVVEDSIVDIINANRLMFEINTEPFDGYKKVTVALPMIGSGWKKVFDTQYCVTTDGKDLLLSSTNQIIGYSGGIERIWHISSCENCYILSGVTEIEEFCLYEMPNLKRVAIPDGVSDISRCFVYQCDKIKRIEFPDSVEILNTDCLARNKALTEIVFGEESQLTMIGTTMLKDCVSLEEFTIPKNVTNILANPFDGCTNFKKLITKATTPPTLSSSLGTVPALAEIVVPVGSGDAYKSATNWSKYADIIVEEGASA